MGFLRTITLYNDHWDTNTIRRQPEAFVKALLESMDYADEHHKAFHFGPIITQPSRHADDHAVFVHRGNTVLDITSRYFEQVNPDVAKDYLKTAQDIVIYAKKRLKERK